MTCNAGCSMRRLAALAIAMISLTGCATVGSESGSVNVCPPVVEYKPEFQGLAAGELAQLPDGSAILRMMSDYAVMREQSRECASP